MAQDELLNYLKENKDKWFTSGDLSKILGINKTSVAANFQKLRKFNVLDHKKVKLKGHSVWSYLYRWKSEDLKKDKDMNKEVLNNG